MFIGHFAVALAAKKVAPRPSLGTLVLAALLVDGVWPVFMLLGWEKVEIVPGITAVTPLLFVSYPYTHSLVADGLWGALVAGAYYLLRRDRAGALWLAALVLSHWVLDFVSHRPDMPLWPGGPLVGLGLWYSLPATLVVELGLVRDRRWLYASVTRPRDRIGAYAFWALVATLAAIYVSSVFGPPPPSVEVLAMTGVAGWLFVAWALLDRPATVRPSERRDRDGPSRAHDAGHRSAGPRAGGRRHRHAPRRAVRNPRRDADRAVRSRAARRASICAATLSFTRRRT